MSQSSVRTLLTVLGLSVATVAWAGHKQVPTVRLQAETEIAGTPSAIWPYLTQGKNLVTWCPVWKSDKNVAVHLTKVGDALDFTDQWGGGGRSIVTFLSPAKELRIAHEPSDGSYMCQARIKLTPKSGSTLVTYLEQYTDESGPTDLEATAKKVEAEMAETLAALKRGVEKK